MPVIVNCPGCKKQLQLKDELRGKKVKCHCGKVLLLPISQPSPSPVQSTAPTPITPVTRTASASVAPTPIQPITPAPADKISAACTSCGAQFQVNASMAGKAAQCNCGAVIQIPNTSPAPITPIQPTNPSTQTSPDLFASQSPVDPLLGGGAANDPSYVPNSSAGYSQPAQPAPYWGNSSGGAGKRKVKKKSRKEQYKSKQKSARTSGGGYAARNNDSGGVAESTMTGMLQVFGGIGLAILGVVISFLSYNSETGEITYYYGLVVCGVLTTLSGIFTCVAGGE